MNEMAIQLGRRITTQLLKIPEKQPSCSNICPWRRCNNKKVHITFLISIFTPTGFVLVGLNNNNHHHHNTRTVFMLLAVIMTIVIHCKSSPSSRDECRAAPDGC